MLRTREAELSHFRSGLEPAMRRRSGTALASLLRSAIQECSIQSPRGHGVDAWVGWDGRSLDTPRIQLPAAKPKRTPWNKERLIGQKRPLLPKQVWAIRARLELAGQLRDLALFNLAIDSTLRGCDLVRLWGADLVVGGSARERVTVIQSKTGRPVQFEVSENTRNSVLEWVDAPEIRGCVFRFRSRFHASPHLSTSQNTRLVRSWVLAIGLDPNGYGTHSLRRTKAVLIYRKTGNLRAIPLLLGHSKVDSTVRCLARSIRLQKKGISARNSVFVQQVCRPSATIGGGTLPVASPGW